MVVVVPRFGIWLAVIGTLIGLAVIAVLLWIIAVLFGG
jgi:hypothetical protein